jgi:hypothetical protein
VVRFANVLVAEDARPLGVESTVGDLRRDVMPRHVGPVAFTLDGVTYEIDLSTKNAKKLRAAFEPWIEAGRRVGGRRRSSIVSASRTATEPRESAAIRGWARKHGYAVASRFRILADVLDAFRAAGKA